MQIIYDKIEYIIEFKCLNPDFILSLINEELSMGHLMFGHEEDGGHDHDEETHMQEGLITFLFLLVVSIMFFVSVLILSLTKSRF